MMQTRSLGALALLVSLLIGPRVLADAAPPPASAPPVPVPTDQTPAEVPAPSPIPLGHGVLFSGALDGRYRTSDTGRKNTEWLHIAELDIDRPLTARSAPVGNVHLQILGENPPDIPNARGVKFGEAYVLYRLPFQVRTDSTVYLKLGQFQLPFGLLAVYDPHLQIQQPLYAQSLGLRTDWGAAVSGRFYGTLNYDFAVTSGGGPNHPESGIDTVFTFRLGRTFYTRNGVVNVGGSLLQGSLPITDISADHPFAVEIPASGDYRPERGYLGKTRIGGDATLTLKNLTARGEAVSGADKDLRVLGFYAEGDYRFSGRASVLLARSYFSYGHPDSISTRDSVGLTYTPGQNLTLRALYENLYDAPVRDTGRTRHRFTLQLLLRF